LSLDIVHSLAYARASVRGFQHNPKLCSGNQSHVQCTITYAHQRPGGSKSCCFCGSTVLLLERSVQHEPWSARRLRNRSKSFGVDLDRRASQRERTLCSWPQKRVLRVPLEMLNAAWPKRWINQSCTDKLNNVSQRAKFWNTPPGPVLANTHANLSQAARPAGL
jgi:hypothetical protein